LARNLRLAMPAASTCQGAGWGGVD